MDGKDVVKDAVAEHLAEEDSPIALRLTAIESRLDAIEAALENKQNKRS